jgi:RNA polymerase sigma-70 factor (ECF subfamily)
VKSNTDRHAEFLALLQAHRALLYRVTRLYGQSAADRADLAQEAIANLWRAFPRYDCRLRFSTWMYRITLNVAISWRRRERTQTQHLLSAGAETLENVAALDAAVDSEDVALLYRLIERFEELDRALLLLYLDGRSHQEISDVLGMTTTNVATRIGRLKDKLRKDFDAAGHLSPHSTRRTPYDT